MTSGKTYLEEEDIPILSRLFLIQMLNFKPAYEVPPGVERINVTDLKVGMTVYKETPQGKLAPDCILKEYYRTSDSMPTLSFRTTAGQLVIWRPCGKVWVRYA